MFEVFQSEKNNKFYFNLKAKNGQIILSSQGYADKGGAMNGIESCKKNAPDDSKFERKTAANGKFHFNLKAGNGQNNRKQPDVRIRSWDGKELIL